MSWKQQNGPRVLEASLKNKKDGGRVAEEFVLAQFPRRFLEISSRCLPLTGSGQIQRKTNKQTVVIVFLGLKDWCFKSRREMSRFQEVPFAISLVLIFPWKSTLVKIHLKMASAWLVFSAKNPVKSDNLALIEGKVLNEMILDIYIPVVPIDNWLGATHNQRQKTLKVASVLLKTKSWPECIYTIYFTHIVLPDSRPANSKS